MKKISFYQLMHCTKMHLKQITELIKKGAQWLFLVIFPPFCCCCKEPLHERIPLCILCTHQIEPLVSHKIELTKKYALTVFCVGTYKEPLKNLILAKGRSDILACYHMAQLIHQHTMLSHMKFDYIIPVPLHWTRYAKRGYNQAAEIAKHLSVMTGIPVAPVIKRCKQTPFQSTLKKEQRKTNVQQAFTLAIPSEEKALFKNKRLLLVDDVMTTGATLQASARALLPLRPQSAQAVVLARTH